MLAKVKKIFYFVGAYYFRLFALIYLKRWHPKIVVITGSSGKTTLLHLIESQLGNKAKYSHKANSAFGIPFDILGLERSVLTYREWPALFLKAPFRAFRKINPLKLYIAEADCDRPYEGKFLATLLQPDITLWVSSSDTHSANFERVVKNNKFAAVEEAIASEFAQFVKFTKDWSAVNGDSTQIIKALPQTRIKLIKITKSKYLDSYRVKKDETDFSILGQNYNIKALLPEETFYSICMVKHLLDDFHLKIDPTFKNFTLPPGRGCMLSGIKNTILIDSSYNATPEGMASTLRMFQAYPANKKWAVLGDMIELGNKEKKDHEYLAQILSKTDLRQLVLVGPRLHKFTYPVLQILKVRYPVKIFETPKEALGFMDNISGGETILFKGARFLEGVIEKLLKDKKDTSLLPRREEVWQKRRKVWQL